MIIRKKSHTVTAAMDAPLTAAKGVIIAKGGAFGGLSSYVLAGRLKYCCNPLGRTGFYVEATCPLPPGPHEIRI